MVKGQKTRKAHSKGQKKSILTIPQLRKAFDHMDKVVSQLEKTAKHSFSGPDMEHSISTFFPSVCGYDIDNKSSSKAEDNTLENSIALE